MKFNWKVLVAVVVIVGAIFWAVDSVRARSLSGTNLTFLVGNGVVTVTNPSDSPVASQLTSTGSRTFTISSGEAALSGISTQQGSGSKITQLFEFSLLPGPNVFTITRGTNVSFVGSADTSLQATIEPLTSDNVRATLIVALVVILCSLYFISRTTGHHWISNLRGKQAPIPVPVVATPVGDPNRGRDGRMYSNYGGKD